MKFRKRKKAFWKWIDSQMRYSCPTQGWFESKPSQAWFYGCYHSPFWYCSRLATRPGKYTSQVVFTINEVFQATFLLLPASNELSHSIVLRFVPASQQRRIFWHIFFYHLKIWIALRTFDVVLDVPQLGWAWVSLTLGWLVFRRLFTSRLPGGTGPLSHWQIADMNQ